MKDKISFELRERAKRYLAQSTIELWGNARTHEVTVRPEGEPPRLLLAPKWMWESKEWGDACRRNLNIPSAEVAMALGLCLSGFTWDACFGNGGDV